MDQVDPIEIDMALIRLVDSINDIENGCLSCSIRSNQGEDFSIRNRETATIQRLHPSKMDGEVFNV